MVPLSSSGIGLTTCLRYNYIVNDIVDATDPSLEITTDFHVATAGSSLSVPTGLELFSRSVQAIGTAGITHLPSDRLELSRTNLLYEIGGGIGLIDETVTDGVRGLKLGVSGAYGEDIVGVRFGVSLAYWWCDHIMGFRAPSKNKPGASWVCAPLSGLFVTDRVQTGLKPAAMSEKTSRQ